MLDDSDGKGTRVADYFDNMFRLLREDLAYELKEELERVLNQKQGRHGGLLGRHSRFFSRRVTC